MRTNIQTLLSLVYLALPALAGPIDFDGSLGASAAVPITFDSIDWKEHRFQAPSETDVRSPCPGLNTLANHGFLPRDGTGLTVENIVKAGLDAYNIHPGILAVPAKIGSATSSSLNSSFTLKDIRLHNNLEHDVSLSRGDLSVTGDNFSFNETIFAAIFESNPGADVYNVTSAGQVQKRRLEESKAENPRAANTMKEFAIRTAESVFYLSIMGDPIAAEARKEFVNIFFREERLPLKEGWRRPINQLNSTTLVQMFVQISAHSEWTADEGVCASFSFAAISGNTPITL